MRAGSAGAGVEALTWATVVGCVRGEAAMMDSAGTMMDTHIVYISNLLL